MSEQYAGTKAFTTLWNQRLKLGLPEEDEVARQLILEALDMSNGHGGTARMTLKQLVKDGAIGVASTTDLDPAMVDYLGNLGTDPTNATESASGMAAPTGRSSAPSGGMSSSPLSESPVRTLSQIHEDAVVNGSMVERYGEGFDDKSKCLGEGFHAQGVFKVSSVDDPSTFYAAKQLKEVPEKGTPHWTMIMRELGVLSRANHPNLVSLHECILDETGRRPRFFIVMPFLEGEELKEVVQQRPLTEPHAAVMVHALASGLRYMHEELRTMHRDVKPENIMLLNGDPTRPVLVDYGLSRMVDDDVDDDEPGTSPSGLQRTYTGNMGTPCYQAPESIDQRYMFGDTPMSGIIKVPGYEMTAEYDRKVDVWSLGGILFYALSGLEPARNNEYDFDAGFDGVSDGAKQLIQGMMCHQVSTRLTCKEVMEDAWVLSHI